MKTIFNNYNFMLKDIEFLISSKKLALDLDFIKKQINHLYILECEKLVF